ncbi:putative DNA binding domain-containing protein [Bacillus sp. NP157]|nr:putative DNA binding domain-containing protein [Bacillus sp. NP157]
MARTLPTSESLTVEFKSDRAKLSDNDLAEAIVALANTDGGELWLGVEDDGRPTGLHRDHLNLDGLAGLVAARTSPSVRVGVSQIQANGVLVAQIIVPQMPGDVCTTSGKYLWRKLKSDGSPESAPMHPHDRASRSTSFGLTDLSAQPVTGADLSDFDPLERERLRQSIERYGGDSSLIDLNDEKLEGAMGLSTRLPDGRRVPTLAGLLLIGREESLRRLVPTHEIAFQVLSDESVRFNDFQHIPLLKALSWLESSFHPHNPDEDELQIDLFRVKVPRVDERAFREAVANALVHRDYMAIGAIHVRLEEHSLTISNPGGLVDGVTVASLLTTEPRPRNPRLADIMKRIGIVERAGRGVDAIYRGMLRFGRSVPDYGSTDRRSVVLRLSVGAADRSFLRMIVEEESRLRRPLPLDSLLVLSVLKEAKRVATDELARTLNRDVAQVKRTVEALVETGIVEAHGGTPRTRSYTLSARIYRASGDHAAFTRQVGFGAIQNEQMILNFVRQHGRIRRSDVTELCRLTAEQARSLLKKLTLEEKLIQHGTRRGAYYSLGQAG